MPASRWNLCISNHMFYLWPHFFSKSRSLTLPHSLSPFVLLSLAISLSLSHSLFLTFTLTRARDFQKFCFKPLLLYYKRSFYFLFHVSFLSSTIIHGIYENFMSPYIYCCSLYYNGILSFNQIKNEFKLKVFLAHSNFQLIETKENRIFHIHTFILSTNLYLYQIISIVFPVYILVIPVDYGKAIAFK